MLLIDDESVAERYKHTRSFIHSLTLIRPENESFIQMAPLYTQKDQEKPHDPKSQINLHKMESIN